MLTLGVDLASQPKRTATCLICWDRKPAVVTSFSACATDCDLLDLFGRADKIGIDAPFGWPARFVRAIHGNSTSTDWPTVDICQLRFRTTDQVVRKKLKRWPLSVSSGWIAMPAMRVARLLAIAAANGEAVDRSGSGRFVETYPAVALSVWGFPSQGYKRKKGAKVRDQLVGDLAEKTSSVLTLTKEHLSQCSDSDDALDALVAALIARTAAVGCCEPIPYKHRDLAAEEGWIALPRPESLKRLA